MSSLSESSETPVAQGDKLSIMQKQIQITAKIYECRDAAKSLLGDGYNKRMFEYGEIISAVSSSKKIGIIAAASELANDPRASGYEKIQILASAVEMIEPSA